MGSASLSLTGSERSLLEQGPGERFAIDAGQRALELEPNLPEAAERQIGLQVEGGDLNGAWDAASALLRRRPDSPGAHFALRYLLRYAGLLEESARECEAAIARDPKSYRWRSCASTYIWLGDYERAKTFLDLDAGSELVRITVNTEAAAERIRAAIVRALKKRDPDAARAAMHKHITRVIKGQLQNTEVREMQRVRDTVAEKRRLYTSTR